MLVNSARQKLYFLTPFFFALLFFSESFSQTLNFRQYSVDDGLPFVQVFTIYQDSKGNLWSGGYGGLSSFDGVNFTNYAPRNGPPNHWVTSIAEDQRGQLWIGTIEGASIFSNGTFQNFTVKDGLPDNYVNCLYRDDRNVFWIGTAKGICRYDGEKFIYDPSEGPGKSSVLCIYGEPNTSRVWMGTSDGVYMYDNGKYTHYPMQTFSDDNVTAITRSADGKILAGTSDGVYRLEGDHFSILITQAGLEMPEVNALITDRSGITWIGADNGLFSYDGKKFARYDISPDLNSEKVISLFIDYENSLWLGTHAGLFRYRGAGFVSFGPRDGLIGSFTYGITQDGEGNIWVCSESKGVYKYDGKTFTLFGKHNGLSSEKANDCMYDSTLGILVGTNRGLDVISGSQVKVFRRSDGLNCDTVNCIRRDRHGRIWLGGGKGITLFDNGKFTAYTIPSSPENSFDVWSIFEDRTGRIWVGTYVGGLYIFDGKNFSDGKKLLGVKTDSYFDICEDKTGKLYFATLDGIYIYNGKTTERISEQNGMSSELAYGMILDNESKYLWIGTNQGINRLDVAAYDKDGSIVLTTFGKEEGFSGVESNTNGFYIDRDGKIWFGTVNGLICYSPKDFRTNIAPAKTSITGFRLFYQDTIIPQGAELEWDENNIAFEYAGICLTNPAKVRYRFMLAGFDQDWSPPTADRSAKYSNLPPGQYTFKVISCNNEGMWNEDPATYTFTILTPFWKKTWFWFLLTLAAMGVLGSAILFRIRQIKYRERLESETKISLARNELKALRAQMNPHFVFNSLNSIQHFILTNKSADAGKYLNKFARLMRVILNNSEKSLITVKEEIEYLTLYLGLEEMRFEGKFSWSIDVPDDIDTDFIEIPAMLLQPYVENAILHGLTPKKEKGHLLIELRLKGNQLVCSIIDDGIGRERAREMRRLSQQKDHKSLGMKITHDRLELINRLHGSHLSLTIIDLYHPGGSAAGTRVDIFIPVS
ncbi:MAG TPA: two-component regulator propeller domain-containing protein [Bacteroidia bacterium]|nr:two-component regulator propeller domain-containing protein [Bacteroidia bacterium]